MEITVEENTNKKRFETLIDEHVAFMEYIRAKGNVIYLTHTEVPLELGGKGIGTALVKKVLHIIKEEGATVAPLCPFVAGFIKRNETYKALVAPGYNV